jgi:acyl-CoA thioesterase-1
MRLLLVIFAILIWITVRTLVDKEPPTLVKPPVIESEKLPTEKVTERQRHLFAIGDSLTAGYQLSPEQSFPAQLQELLKEQKITVINAWKSGDTSSQMRERFDWSLTDAKPGDIALITAGANDGLQWLTLEQLEDNLTWMITEAKNRELIVVLWWMQLPPNYGLDYTRWFKEIFPRIASELDVLLVPFILEWVAANPSLNLDDGIHPNAEWYRIIAQNLADFLEENDIIDPTF